MVWLAQKKGKGGVGDARTEVTAVGPDRFERARHGDQQVLKIVRLTVGESLLGQSPDTLVRVELGRIRRESLQMNPLCAGAELTHEPAAMRVPAVPQQEDVAVDLTEEGAQEITSLELPDVIPVELKVKVEALATGRNRDTRDHGDAVAPVEVMNRRRLAHGRPGASDRRGQLEARFVGEDEVGTQPLGVFFTRGQSSRTKRRISALLRSSAFFCGFWWLHPRACRSLPT